ncbi:hypothetical protein GYMLUDRAFT_79504 [Collybiopsis luxurians FD-317 M1]|nr:hypothetical protein GYMLUDRAFT_79504 [Collybiopsis luxurians FD-317 M1]
METGNVTAADMIFPSKGLQVLCCLIYLLGASILAHCLSRRISAEQWNWSSIRDMSWARLCVLLIFFDSWLFLFISGILVYGIGLESKEIVCALGIYLCVLFYATSKLLIYSFLIEKVYLVWSPTVSSGRRLKSPLYLGCMVMIAMYGVVIASMVAGKIHYLRENDGVCIIGLKRFSSLALLAFDLFINIVLTVLFLWPVFRANLTNPRLKRVAVRTLFASGVALTTSCVNMLVLAMLRGHERGWVCLGSCGADVIINALAIFWVTKNRETTQFAGSSSNGNNLHRDGRRPPEIKIVTDSNVVLTSQPPTPLPQTLLKPYDTSDLDSSQGNDDGSQSPPTSPSRKFRFTRPFSPKGGECEDLEMQQVVVKPSIIDSAVAGLFRTERHPSDKGVHVTVTTKTITDTSEEQQDYYGSDGESQSETKCRAKQLS